MAVRVDDATGSVVLVPTSLRAGTRSVLANYLAGTDARVATYPTTDGCADVDALAEQVDEETLAVYAASPTVRGTIDPSLSEICSIAHEASALAIVGTDPVALGVLEPPAAVGADVAVGDAASLGTGLQYGMGLGIFACRERYRRQVPGRLVGATTDATDRRAFTLTLQAREQHVRRERATSNVCTNQAWLALRTAIHLALLGPDGLADLGADCVRWPRDLAARIDALAGYEAPVHDRHHFREFVVACERPATEVRAALADAGYAVHAVDDHELQICVTEPVLDERDGLVAAMAEVGA